MTAILRTAVHGLECSSSAAGLFTSFYLGVGWLAVLVGALGVGAVLAVCTRLCRRLVGTIAAGLYVFSVLPANAPVGRGLECRRAVGSDPQRCT